MKPELNKEITYGTNYGIKDWMDLRIKDSRQYIVQGKAIELPENQKILESFSMVIPLAGRAKFWLSASRSGMVGIS